MKIHFQEGQDMLYETMVVNGIGNKVADLYINWAFYFEMKQDYEAAECIFRRGIDASAEPLTLLKAAHENSGFSMSQNYLYKNDMSFQHQQQLRMKKQLQEITALRINVGGDDDYYNRAFEVRSMALHSFDKDKLENYCLPFSGAKRMVTGQTQHNESLAQNLMDSARKMRRNQNQKVKVSVNRLSFNDDDCDSQILKPIPLPPEPNMYRKGIRVGKNYPRKNKPQRIVETRAYVDPEIGTYRKELPGFDKIMLIPATNVAFSPEELKAYHWFKQHGITNAFTLDQDRVWATGYDVPIRCADIFTRSNFPQSEWNLPRIAHYYLNDNHDPHKLMCNMFELYPDDCSEEFSLDEIMWRKRKAKLAQSQAVGGSDYNANANQSAVKLAGRKLNRTNSMESNSKLSPIIEMDLNEHDDDADSELGAVDQTMRRRESVQRKVMAGNELTSKKRKSSIFPTFDALNDTCTTQMFGNLLHRSVISTPNPKIPKFDTTDADLTSDRLPEETELKLFIDETMIVGNDVGDPNAINRNKPNDRQQFAIYEDSMTRVTMMQVKNIKNDANTKLTNENKENEFPMENRMQLEHSKLATIGICRNTEIFGLPRSKERSEPMMKGQNQQSKRSALAFSAVQQNQPPPPPPPIFTDELQQCLVRPLKNSCELFEAIIAHNGPSDELQKSLDGAYEMLATVLNSDTTNNCSIFKEPTAIANITSSSASLMKTNNVSQKIPNQSQYVELLDTTEEFEALEAQCASPPVNDATMTPIKPVDQEWTKNQTQNKSTENFSKFFI